MRQLAILFMAANALASCSPSSAPQKTSPEPASQNAHPNTTGSGSTSTTVTANGGAPVDVLVELALELPTPDLVARGTAVVNAVMQSFSGTKADVHLAVVEGKQARGSDALPAAPNGVSPTSFKAVDFELKAKDVLVAAIASDCGAADSTFPDPHTEAGGHPIVCKQDISTLGATSDDLAHAWLWSLNPIRGVVQPLFRANAARIYVIVSNGEVEFLDAHGFTSLAAAQSTGKVSVIAAAPLDAGKIAGCGTSATVATRLNTVAQGAGGRTIDFCDGAAEAVGASVANAVKALVP